MALLMVGGRGRGRAAAARKREPGTVVVQLRRSTAGSFPAPGSPTRATIDISVGDPELGRAIEQQMASSLRSAFAERARIPPWPTATVRTRAELARAGERVAGAIVRVPLAAARPSTLPALVGAIERAGAAGIQLVVGQRGALPAELAATLFSLLETRRGAKPGCPLLLCRTDALPEIWYFLSPVPSGATAGSRLPAPPVRPNAANSPAHRVWRKP